MFGFLRGRPGHLELTVPPPERGIHAAAFHRDTDRLRQLDQCIFVAYKMGDLRQADRLLDLRNGIRKPRPAEPPVIPGPS